MGQGGMGEDSVMVQYVILSIIFCFFLGFPGVFWAMAGVVLIDILKGNFNKPRK
jgi:hypothetical protein